MSPKLRNALLISAALTMACGAMGLQAQEESGEAAAAPSAPVKPRPSELLPRAPQSLTLDLINTGKHLIAVGERGHILVSNDGAAWAQVSVPVRATLTAVSFIDADNGWAVGHDATILRSSDGGKTWRLQNFEPEKEQAFLDVLFTDAQHGYAVGAFGLFYATTDGGDNWAEVEAAPIREEELYFHSISRLGDGRLFIVGESGMMGVGDAEGGNWKRLTSPYEGTFFGALPHGDKGAIAFGLRGNVYVTDDVSNDKGWSRVETHTIASFFGGSLLPDGRALLAGASGTAMIVDVANKAASPLQSGLSSSLTGALMFKDRLVVAGDSGLRLVAQQP